MLLNNNAFIKYLLIGAIWIKGKFHYIFPYSESIMLLKQKMYKILNLYLK